MGYSKLTYEEFVSAPEVFGAVPPKWADAIAARGYPGICAVDFYGNIFGEDLEDARDSAEAYCVGEYAGIAIECVKVLDKDGNPVLDKRGHAKQRGLRTTITKGNFELYDLIDRSDNFCMVAPVSYAGKVRTNANARYLYAFCIEVDYIEPRAGLSELFYSWERDTMPVPKPTYIVCSGRGLHLYYVFERPLPLWKNVFESLAAAKRHLTPMLWTKYITTAYEEIEYESVNQAFRCVGTRTKDGSYALAFAIGDKVSVEYMNKFLPEDSKIVCIYKSECSLAEAKERYPKWYERRIEKGEPRGRWYRHKPIYYSWKEKILRGAVVGRRYNCLENLCSLAAQCRIPPEEVEKDCWEVAERFERLTNDDQNHFTAHDVRCALKTYYGAEEQAFRRRIEYIARKTGIPLQANKRNGRTREKHLERARAVQEIDFPDGQWRNKDGRPKGSGTAFAKVKAWRIAHPRGKKSDCVRDTGLSKPTVYKWWNWEAHELEQIMKEMGVDSLDQIPHISDRPKIGEMKPFDWNNIPPEKMVSVREAKKRGVPLGCPLVKKRRNEDENNQA